MDTTLLLAYIGVITVLIAIPGPSSMLISLHGYKYGFRKANTTIIGNLLGTLVLMGLTIIGLGILLTTSEAAFTLVKYFGASYLIFLGVRTCLLSSEKIAGQPQGKLRNVSGYSLLKQGFLTGVSNPKDILFFTALFPTFLNCVHSITTQMFILMLVWLLVDYSLKLIYLSIGRGLNNQFSNPRLLLLFNKMSGGAFITFGLALCLY
jgi:threonine/homoserine/homoserine lactone efflux protein